MGFLGKELVRIERSGGDGTEVVVGEGGWLW